MRFEGYVKIIKLGLPILIGQLGMIVVGFADTTMVGRYSTDALASASFVNNLFNVAIITTMGFSYGLTPLMGALFSNKRYRKIGEMLRNGVVVNVVFTLVMMAGMTAVYFNLERLRQPEELLPLIRPYYLIYLAGMLPIAVFNVFGQWSYSIRRTKMPMWITLASNVINIAGNWMLIYGHCGFPELGLTGAGLSTLVARLFLPIAIVTVFLTGRDYRSYREGFMQGRLSSGMLGQIWRTSWPVSMQMAFETGSFSGAGVMAGWLGSVSLAAYQIFIIIGTLGFCVYYSMGSAVSVLVANAAGQGDRQKMRVTAARGYRIILMLAAMSSTVFFLFADKIIGIFTTDEVVESAAIALIIPLIVYQLGDATQINYANALRGSAKVMPMIWIAFVSYVVVGLPATYIMAFPMGMGTPGIVYSFSVSLFLAAGLFYYFFRRATRG
ncbi:MAG: MATE family efflux transporter [Paramuribaculum sp.]|nr:MATE family efflux transporter [Paramuribaculum sp.]